MQRHKITNLLRLSINKKGLNTVEPIKLIKERLKATTTAKQLYYATPKYNLKAYFELNAPPYLKQSDKYFPAPDI